MKITYDKKQDAVYFLLSDGEYKVTKKMNDNIMVDYDSTGTVLGIEVLDASTTISQFDPQRMTIALQ